MGNKIKKLTIFILKTIWLVFIIASFNNIANQISAVIRAEKTNNEIEKEVAKLEEENISLTENIRYATSSAFKEEALRSYFGVGTANDYWVILPDMELEEIEEKKEDIQIPNWQKWLELFTKES